MMSQGGESADHEESESSGPLFPIVEAGIADIKVTIGYIPQIETSTQPRKLTLPSLSKEKTTRLKAFRTRKVSRLGSPLVQRLDREWGSSHQI